MSHPPSYEISPGAKIQQLLWIKRRGTPLNIRHVSCIFDSIADPSSRVRKRATLRLMIGNFGEWAIGEEMGKLGSCLVRPCPQLMILNVACLETARCEIDLRGSVCVCGGVGGERWDPYLRG